MTITLDYEYVREHIRQVPNFPKPGILFLDITTATKDAKAMQYMTDFLYEQFKDEKIDYVTGIESRGFIFGAAVAYKLGAGFVPIRKPNKLPAETIKEEYSLEYGTNTLCIHEDALSKDDKVLIVDDLLATGGTALAAAHLCEKTGAEVVGLAFVIDLVDLKGKELLKDYKVKTLVEFEGE